MSVLFDLQFTDDAKADLRLIQNRKHLEQVASRIEFLRTNPELGKPLRGNLTGFRSLRAVKSRYRVIYAIEIKQITIFVVAVGLRKGIDQADVYKKFEHLVEEAKSIIA